VERILWYFADPMCSWCWGFAPVLGAIKENYADQFKIALILGGLRPGTTEPIAAASREEILDHWRAVHRMTGQAFGFDGAMPDGFVYNTEPACRATVAVGEINPDLVLAYFRSIQEAFYVHGLDVTLAETLSDLAEKNGLSRSLFHDRFQSDDILKKTQSHFHITRQSGVRGFPSAILQRGSDFSPLTNGYRAFDELRPILDQWLVDTP